MSDTLKSAIDFKKRHPKTIAWRLKQHSKIIETHINPDEKLILAFGCQKNNKSYDLFSTYVVAVTDKRIMIAQKRMLFGYLYISVTPELYNDLSIAMGLIWGKITIDTVKEVISLSNIAKEALPEIETAITSFVSEATLCEN